MIRFGAVALIACCVIPVACSNSASRAPEVGTDYYAIAPEAVSEVSVASRDQRVWGYKWDGSPSFSLVVAYRSPPRVETCVAGSGFRSWLQALSRLPIRGRPSTRLDPASPDWVAFASATTATSTRLKCGFICPGPLAARLLSWLMVPSFWWASTRRQPQQFVQAARAWHPHKAAVACP